MKLEKSLVLVLCALLVAVCGCGTEEPKVDPDTPDIAAVELEEFTNSIGMKFKLIPAGEFTMGSPEDEEGRFYNETQHHVRITEPYYLGVHEVTQGQWEELMGSRPWEDEVWAKSGSDRAVSWVSWADAVEFCEKLSAKEGREYRLPTEAEWEYACRAGSQLRYCFGDDDSDLGDYAWYAEDPWDVDEEYAHPVGQKRANAWGLYDMHGNVFEWCSDWYGEDYYKNSPADDPTGPSTGSDRVFRGGSWYRSSWLCRSAYQSWLASDYRASRLGFRVALDPAE